MSAEGIKLTLMATLLAHCQKFVADQEITCADAVYQTDRVIENAYEFIHGICDIVGYWKPDDGASR